MGLLSKVLAALMANIDEPAKHLVDTLAIGALLATLFDWLPRITALLTLVWIAMRLFESRQAIKINGQTIQLNARKLEDDE